MGHDDIDRMRGDVRVAWHRFLDVFEPMRAPLYRYCRSLTRSPWDAEDLVQETLTRAFVTLGTMFHDVPNPRAWLFRVASNAWIDRARRAHHEYEHAAAAPADATDAIDPQATRETAGTLLAQLSPQERAAVVLKDVLDFPLEEIADALSTSVDAVKAALHRGRGRLVVEEEQTPHRAPAPGVLDAFCEAFNARDVDRLTMLLLESATVEISGVVTEYGRDAPKDPRTGSIAAAIAPISFDGVPPELLEGYLGTSPRVELRLHRGRWLLLFWYDHVEGPIVRTVMRAEIEGDRIARLRSYFFSPDVIADVCAELGVPFRTNGYRYWPTGR